jgi:hypothetical protein
MSAQLVEVRLLIDGKTYAFQGVGDVGDSLFATNVGHAVSVAILEHAATDV